jgi:hypothetical protein
MSSVLIRVSPETKELLDSMREGKTVQGKGYYRRSMKYDDLIRGFMKLDQYKNSLDFICILLTGWEVYGHSVNLNSIVEGFIRYLRKFRRTLDNRYSNDLDKCERIIECLDVIIHNKDSSF